MIATTISFPRAAHAEGPLTQTVRCLVQTLLLTGCSEPAAASPSSTPQSQPSPAAPSSNAGSTPASSPVSKNAQTSQPSSQTPPLAPLPSEPAESLLAITASTPPVYPAAQPFNYVAYFNTYSKYATQQVKGEATTFIEPSKEGWKIAGIAWYWWAVPLSLLAGLGATLKYRQFRRSSALSKTS